MLTLEKYNELRAKIDTYELWRNDRQSITVDEEATAPVHVSNEERSAVEVYEFAHSAPEHYFAYVAPARDNPVGIIGRHGYVTTWTGDVLGEIYWRGQPFRSNIGDRRQNIRVRAINGRAYSGTFYESAGDYCRLRLMREPIPQAHMMLLRQGAASVSKSATVKRLAAELGSPVIDVPLTPAE